MADISACRAGEEVSEQCWLRAGDGCDVVDATQQRVRGIRTRGLPLDDEWFAPVLERELAHRGEFRPLTDLLVEEVSRDRRNPERAERLDPNRLTARLHAISVREP